MASLTDTFMATVDLTAGAEITLSAPADRTVFLYVVRGEAMVDGAPVAKWNLAQLGDGDEVHILAEREALLLFGHSAPLREPVVAHGPFVMNTREEILEAVRDFRTASSATRPISPNPAALFRLLQEGSLSVSELGGVMAPRDHNSRVTEQSGWERSRRRMTKPPWRVRLLSGERLRMVLISTAAPNARR
jgi:hypothetical protein